MTATVALHNDGGLQVWTAAPAGPGTLGEPRHFTGVCKLGGCYWSQSALEVETLCRQHLAHRFEFHESVPCPHCKGTGRVARGEAQAREMGE